MKYAHIDDTNGKLLGWYGDDIYDIENIPTPNIEVSEEVWQNAINSNHNKVNADGTTGLFDFRTQAEIDADNVTEYQSLREAAYPSIQDQMDMQYWDAVNGTTTWADAIAAVKAMYPKP